ncbi:MAG: lipopolysaccharide heptosyltransferase II [Candidatus Eisenbacteria bacterium]|uniref:lipopolysaccharide heptosyltransferase II n=1 Tax=Eiseniibacteriota bacterium TaxID=2212470 RepID=A0A956SD66_UNCEI|nr:lipopolysaccharide heptosyltransferase II [Candidatus Eisenbacteria bacterium]
MTPPTPTPSPRPSPPPPRTSPHKPAPTSERTSRERIDVRVPNWIGDAIMAAPALLGLAKARPDVEWTLWAVPRTASLFEGFLELYGEGSCFSLEPLPPSFRGPRRFADLVGRVRRNAAAAALVLPPSFSSAVLHAAAGTPRRFGWPGEGRRPLLTDVGPRPRRDVHLRVQYVELAELLARRLWGRGVEPPVEGTRLPLSARALMAGEATWERTGLVPERTIALAPGATYGETKRWPSEKFSALGRDLLEKGWSLLWFGGPAERELCERLAEETRSVSLAGSLSLPESLACLTRVRAMISNDSGAMHMAQASGTPVVGIFGSTSPTWTGPVGPDARVVHLGIHCSPCFSRTCPTAIECLTGIEVSTVREQALELASQGRTGLRPAVFIDRDGTLIELVPYLRCPEDVRLVPGAGKALRELADRGVALVVITNQSVVARGEATEDDVARVHERLRELLAAEGVILDGIEVCPHHPDFGPECACRKPSPGMILRAAHRLGIDLERSWMIGDNEGDVGAAEAAGVRFVLVRTGYGRDVEPGLPDSASVADDITIASQEILSSLPTPFQA